MERQDYIDHHIKLFLERWADNLAHFIPGQKYIDRPESTMRILALTMAEVAWELQKGK